MNSYVHDSPLLNRNFRIKTIRIPHSREHNQVGALSVVKLIAIFLTGVKLFFTTLFYRPRFVYFQISPLGGAFIRDVLFVTLIKITGTKIVYHMHGKGIAQEQNRKHFKKLYEFTFRNEEVICLSESLTEDLIGVFDGKPFIVPNVLKLELQQPPSRTYSGKLNLLYISNLFISKGILVFIKTLALLKKEAIPFNARIVGNESEVTRTDLEAWFEEYKLNTDEVQYVGPKYGEAKWREFTRADILLFPTLNDIWGLVILEAMQASMPVIASIDGAIPEIIDEGKTGFLVEKDKPEQIVEHLKFLHANPKKMIEMGKQGRERFLKTYSYKKFEEKMLETFKTIAN